MPRPTTQNFCFESTVMHLEDQCVNTCNEHLGQTGDWGRFASYDAQVNNDCTALARDAPIPSQRAKLACMKGNAEARRSSAEHFAKFVEAAEHVLVKDAPKPVTVEEPVAAEPVVAAKAPEPEVKPAVRVEPVVEEEPVAPTVVISLPITLDGGAEVTLDLLTGQTAEDAAAVFCAGKACASMHDAFSLSL